MRFSANLFHHGRLVLSGIVGEVEEEATMVAGIVMQSGYFSVPPFTIWPGDGYRLDFEEEISLNILIDRVDQTHGIAYFNRTT